MNEWISWHLRFYRINLNTGYGGWMDDRLRRHLFRLTLFSIDILSVKKLRQSLAGTERVLWWDREMTSQWPVKCQISDSSTSSAFPVKIGVARSELLPITRMSSYRSPTLLVFKSSTVASRIIQPCRCSRSMVRSSVSFAIIDYGCVCIGVKEMWVHLGMCVIMRAYL